MARQVAMPLTDSSPRGIQGPKIQQGAETVVDCFLEAVQGRDSLHTFWQIQVIGPAAKDFFEVIHQLDAKVREFAKCNPRAYQTEIRVHSETAVLEYEKALQRQRAAEELQAAADRHEHERMERVTNGAHENRPGFHRPSRLLIGQRPIYKLAGRL
jgi:hypothetical protein